MSHPLSVTSCASASDCPPQTSIAGCVSSWDTVEVSPLVCGAVGCVLRSPPRPRGPRRPTQRRSQPVAPAAPSRTGSLLAGAGPSSTAPVTMVSGCGGRWGRGSGERGAVGGVAAVAHVHSRDGVSGARLRSQREPLAFARPGILSQDRCWGPLSFLGRFCRARDAPRYPPWTFSEGNPPIPQAPVPARSSQLPRGCSPEVAR